MLEISRKYTLMHEIKIDIPSPITMAIKKIGIAQSICHEIGKPINRWIAVKTIMVGTNLNSAITVAEIGSITRGKEVFRFTVPEVLEEFASEVSRLGVEIQPTEKPLTFGTWIGGDRDGNPNVTPDITRETIVVQVGHAIRVISEAMTELRQSLSVSTRIIKVSKELEESVERDLANIPEFEARYRRLNAREPYRLKTTLS